MNCQMETPRSDLQSYPSPFEPQAVEASSRESSHLGLSDKGIALAGNLACGTQNIIQELAGAHPSAEWYAGDMAVRSQFELAA